MAEANSCCCGATKASPCACMKKGIMKCSKNEPMCACYKAKANLKKSFDFGWSVVKNEQGGSKSWQQMDPEEDSGWTEDAYQCRGCGCKQTPDEWEQKRCKECGTRNTIHPSMR
tara:strand:- start:69390 stop:69731 length:342 start_codon:yes stop_codon:yes gene_type:complete